jgi:hypothetical protein
MKCAKCDLNSVIKQGNQWFCERHYRFGSMRSGAKRANKYVPTYDELEQLFNPKMICPDCKVKMNWRAKDGQTTVASLQHYRNGKLGIVCRSCNTRHSFMKDDLYQEMPKDHKLCPKCKLIKPATYFSCDNGRSGQFKRKSYCKSCSDILTNKWKEKNREKYNEYQRAYRKKRRTSGNPIAR